MFSMDSNRKGKSWVGNICQQFEDFFQDVDDLVTKGTVKYVEIQVHNVGASVKKLYSDVQDKLPPLVKNVKEQQTLSTANKINVAKHQLVVEQGCIESSRANESMPNEHHVPQRTKLPLSDLSQEKISDLPSGKDDDATTWNDADYGFEDYNLTPESANTNSDKKISETCVNHNTFMPPMAASPVISISNADISVIRKEINDGFFDDKESHSNISADGWLFEDQLLPVFNSTDPNEIEAHEENGLTVDPLLFSACNAGHKATTEYGTCCDSFPTEDACVDISNTPQSTEYMFSYFSCDDDEEEDMGFASSTCAASPRTSNMVGVISEDLTHKVKNICNDHIDSSGHTSPEASPTVEFIAKDFTHKVEIIYNDHIDSIGHVLPKASATMEFISDDFTHKVENICNDHTDSIGHVSPKVSATVEFISDDFTHKVENICNDHIDSIGYVSAKASATVEFISDDFTHNVENICNDHIESNGHACTSSTPSCTTLACDAEIMDMLPLMDSNDIISSATSDSVSIVGSCQSRREHFHEDAHSKYDILPSEIGSSAEFGVDATDCEMETVDLSNNVTPDKRHLLLNCNFLHPISHRNRDFKYFKNLIQDAFVSRKRLSKEYEHLAIVYGDIDMEAKLNFELSSLHSCPKSVNVAGTRSLNMSDCDWELL